ncbi:MAG: response regulator transcription factor [Desulfobacula sp.]|nr:response regulator transcription factor [Desulfobacula sp.]
MESKIKVMVVDDHAIVREGLTSLLGLDEKLHVVAEASSSMECLDKIDKHMFDIILMDLKMPGISGIEATRLIKERHPEIKVILLTNYDDEAYVMEAIKSGADGYVLKDVKQGDLIQIIHKIFQNQAFIDPNVTRKMFSQLKKSTLSCEDTEKRQALSHRELQIIVLLVEGKSNKEIAQTIHISPDTVKSHLKNIYRKLGVHNRSQAAKVSIQEGIVHLTR